MTKKTYTDVFPSPGTQSTTLWDIPKNIFTAQGLTVLASNTPQQLLNALCKYLVNIFTLANRTTNSDETVTVSYDCQTTRTEVSNVYRVDTYRIQFYKLTPVTDPDPDDY